MVEVVATLDGASAASATTTAESSGEDESSEPTATDTADDEADTEAATRPTGPQPPEDTEAPRGQDYAEGEDGEVATETGSTRD